MSKPTNPFSQHLQKNFSIGELLPWKGLTFRLDEINDGKMAFECIGLTNKAQKSIQRRVKERIRRGDVVLPPTKTTQPTESKGFVKSLFSRKIGGTD